MTNYRDVEYEPYPSTGAPDERVPLVRYLGGLHRSTAPALRLIAAGELAAERRDDGLWVERAALERVLGRQ